MAHDVLERAAMIRTGIGAALVAVGSLVAVACGGRTSGNLEPETGSDTATSGGADPSGTSHPAEPPSPASADCPKGTSKSFTINESTCHSQLASQTTTCDGQAICSWTIVTPCSLGYEDCNDGCNATRPPGVPPGEYCWSGYGDNGRITSVCGNCGR